MRQLLLSVLAAVCFITAQAAGTTATLQQGDSVKAFYGENAFISAYTAASDSAIITLSGGNFVFPDSIAKSITIIGNGAFSTNTLSPNTNITNSNSIFITADNVTLEGVKFATAGYLYLKNIKNCKIKRSWMDLHDGQSYKHQNTIIEDSYIGIFAAMSGAENLYINNCSIFYFSDINSKDNLATIENTNVKRINKYQFPYAIYRNSNLGFDYTSGAGNTTEATISLGTPSEFYNVAIQVRKYSQNTSDGNYKLSFGNGLKYESVDIVPLWPSKYFEENLPNFKQWSGRGPIDHKMYPSIPRITSSEVDTKTDGEGKLKIKLKVAVQD